MDKPNLKTISYDSNCWYSKFKAIEPLMAIEHDEAPDGSISHWRMIPTGDLEFHDYGAGFLCVRVWVNKHRDAELANAVVSFNTIDDGDLDGWSPNMTLACANTMALTIMTEIFERMSKLPNIEKLQELLRPYNITLH